MVIARTESEETFYWGTLANKMKIEQPQHVPSGKHPREMFSQAYIPATGGVVYIGRHCMFLEVYFITVISDNIYF